MQTFFLAPIGFNAGLTSVALGAIHSLEQAGLRVGFVKPIAQGADPKEPERSTHFARAICRLNPPEPIPMERVERLLSKGQVDQLMEEVVSLYQQAANQVDVVLVEGLVPDQKQVFSTFLNTKIARNLQAQTILVSAADNLASHEIAEQLEMSIQAFGGGQGGQIAGYILNRVPKDQNAQDIATEVLESGSLMKKARLPMLGAIPHEPELLAPRTLDVANHLKARLLHAGQLTSRRVRTMVVTARTVPNIVHLLKPGALIITPGDREDIVLATAMAAMNGVPLAGLLLTCDSMPDPRIMLLCQQAFTGGMPVMASESNTFDTSSALNNMSLQVPSDDRERMERVIEFVAEHLNVAPLKQYIGTPQELRLPPPAFRYQLMEKARKANKRIVLPEGNEPRTIQAAAICHEKGIARCVLIGQRAEILQVAEAQGVTLPESVEIIDPNEVRGRYVPPMVELRKSKGLNAPMAEQQLEDNVVMGTMMLALDEVDGLVSGAVHTTANTIRPALQLIKTAPGASIVSSVFFMLMPEQVLVYGDCAVNPDPDAEQLADIAIQSADSAAAFGIPPRVAMISYSTGSSGSGSDVEKVREATRIAKEKRPDLMIDGPMQYDAASVESVGRQKAPDSEVAGRATVFVFPDLNTGNTTYKAVQRSANVVSVGPMLQGLRKPVNDLSRGALVDDIVYTIALTALQAEQGESI
ncbi:MULTISPECIES: phosphate acetyltransferase [Chromobacterium]|uniref:Phosphate acetyltransferase n=1 Tax=Chromobacterium rhizoryzae TaxID=1778675 RepID=A0AAD0W8M9_9NEIS|nr:MULTISPECIES: phosphate acetyltransferase [Chromobacterium]AXT47515.1 phosphate acetyltransferase [Chromobacterium rhizoryzae]MDH0344154.1 phosphate acetyltransferase [Chromobacterium haemolyticum]OQS32556.1 phosphate acetyltransferase [Chromobacterium haemolyticum]BBH14003.1 phosphate acetyltransferase [Chromobacterium haemolyticum]